MFFFFEIVVCQPKKRVHEDIMATFSHLATTINTPRVSYLLEEFRTEYVVRTIKSSIRQPLQISLPSCFAFSFNFTSKLYQISQFLNKHRERSNQRRCWQNNY